VPLVQGLRELTEDGADSIWKTVGLAAMSREPSHLNVERDVPRGLIVSKITEQSRG
jgi:hypothetical protein